jgi:RNA recognition motif-containing protein
MVEQTAFVTLFNIRFEPLQTQTKHETNNEVGKRPEVKATDWMTAPGVERRAVSDEQQSKHLEKAMRAQAAHLNRIPDTGRGGAQAAIGRYQYRPSTGVPTFTHPYSQDMHLQNNAAYLYHQDHSFGRAYPPQPDHSTTYRPGSNIYRTDPQTGAMFLPVPHPQAHFSQAQMYPGAHNQMRGYPQQHAPSQMPVGIHTDQSPPIGQASYPHPMMASPQVVQTAPHGVVPNHIMAPYIQLAAQGAVPQSEPHLSQVGQQPRYPGYPPMRQPSQFVARAPSGQMFSPQQMHSPAQPSPRPSMQHHIVAARGAAQITAPHMSQRNRRRDGMRSEPMSYSPNAPSFHPGGAFRPAVHGTISMPPNANAPVFTANENQSPRGRRGSQAMPRHASGSEPMLPFPSYMDDMLDPTGLPESQQCTSTTIGPDAEDVVTLWFADIPPESTVEQLKACITKKMSIAEIRDPISYSADQQYTKGWTFVKFLSNKDARDALEIFQGHPFNGGHLKVQVPERRTQAGVGRPRKSSSFHGHHQARSSENTDTYFGHRGSNGGGSTPGRHQPFPHGSFGASPGPRRPRGSSMVQANQVVRLNSAFSKQDARSDLPLPDLPEVSEPSKPATPVPPEHTSAVYDDEHVDAVKKPGKKKPKKRKGKGSRDTSAAPSESTIAEASGMSRGSPAIDPVKEADVVPVPKVTTYASIATGQQVADSVLHNSGENDVIVVAEVEHETPSSIVEPGPVIVEGNVEPEPEVMSPPIAADKEEPPKPVEPADSVIAETEVQVENDDVVDSVPTIEQPASEFGEGDAITSVADISDVQSEATTIAQDRLVTAPAKEVKSKSKGPAQTQSLSAFAMAKNQKKAEKTQAKKARKASRKVSKASTSTATMKTAHDNDTELPELKAVASTSHAAEKKDSAKMDSRDKMHRETSESSSMAGTPKTAQEYPDSAPGTPTPRISASTLSKFLLLAILCLIM